MKRIMFVDDEDANLRFFKLMFDDMAQIDTAESAEEAWNQLEAEDYDVVIADHRMPDENGMSFLSRVSTRWPKIVRVLSSAFIDHSDLKSVKSEAVDVYLEKPWEMSQFKKLIGE